MTAEKDPAPASHGPVELEPLVTRAAPLRHVERSSPSATHPSDGVGSPVPDRPLHECPTCAYILTGLTSRRCPECGEPFTLSEARRQGSLRSPRTQEDLRAVRAHRLLLALGVFLQLAGLLVPMGVLIGAWRGGQLLLCAVSLSIFTFAFLVRGHFALSWTAAMLAAGIVSASLAAMLIFIFV